MVSWALLLALVGAVLAPFVGLVLLLSSSARRRTKEVAGGAAVVLATLVLVSYLSWDSALPDPAAPTEVVAADFNPLSSGVKSINRNEARPEVVLTAVSASSPTEAAPAADEPTQIIEYQGTNSDGREVAHRPAWLNQKSGLPTSTADDSFVLVSARYADVAEAENNLFTKLRPWLVRSLAAAGHKIDTSAVTLSDFKASGAIVSRVEETFDVATKSFVEKVYRVSWLVSPSPGMREALVHAVLPRLTTQHAELQKHRAYVLGAILGGLTLFFGWLAWWGRMIGAMNSSLRRMFLGIPGIKN